MEVMDKELLFDSNKKKRLDEKLFCTVLTEPLKVEMPAFQRRCINDFMYEGDMEVISHLSGQLTHDPIAYIATYGICKKVVLGSRFVHKYGTSGTVTQDFINGEIPSSLKSDVLRDAKEALFELVIGDVVCIIKKVTTYKKLSSERQEMDIMLKARACGLPGLEPLLLLTHTQNPALGFLCTKKLENVQDLSMYILSAPSALEVERLILLYQEKTRELARLYRQNVGIDKNWQPKDLLVDIDPHSPRFGELVPLDWERAKPVEGENNFGSWYTITNLNLIQW